MMPARPFFAVRSGPAGHSWRALHRRCCSRFAAGICVGLVILVWSGTTPSPAGAAGPAVATREFFNGQNAGVAVVVSLQAPGAEFESRIFDPAGRLLKSSGVPGMRHGPMFQLIDPITAPRQLRIEVTLQGSDGREATDERYCYLALDEDYRDDDCD